ncbi:unnamed protein product [Ilex paraguariensis]|uniref:Uncharacterized protein n=1 Tax=Ilex paraguariensis TaxID=185542 RepID=A0ABC8UQP4_9AQUA
MAHLGLGSRTHLFGSPAIIAYTPSINKFILQSESNFKLEWPSVQIVGTNSLVAVEGASHSRLKGFVSRAINQPDALRRVALMVQPRVAAAFQSWSSKGRIIAFKEAKKVTFENIGKFFASFEPGPLLDNLDDLFEGLLNGIRTYPINFPESSYHYAGQCRKKAVAIFREQMEKKRKNKRDGSEATNDLMDGLMNFKDDEGKNLSEIEVLDNIVSLVVAGYKSAALGIMWTLHYLAKYNHVLQKLREENMPLRKTKDGEYITYKDILKLKYTIKVVEETIRLASVAAIVFRTAIKDVEYKGSGKARKYQVFGGESRICARNMLARLQLAIIWLWETSKNHVIRQFSMFETLE